MRGQDNGLPGPRDDEITLQEIASMLWGGKWVIAVTFLVVLGLGAAYTYSRTPVYETSSLVLVENQRSGLSSVLGERGGATARSVAGATWPTKCSWQTSRRPLCEGWPRSSTRWAPTPEPEN
ncbi:MAG: Wzz/FepE/Etk N-terminal domain-containing protein [Salinibacter sp.]